MELVILDISIKKSHWGVRLANAKVVIYVVIYGKF